MSISSPLVLWLWDIHKWSPANYRGQVTRSSGDIALAGRAAVLFMTPLKLRKFQLYTIINFLRYFYKLRSRNKVGMDDEMMMPGLGDAILRPGEVKRPLTAGQFMIQSEVGPPQSRAVHSRPHHIPTRRRNGWKPGLQNVELVRPLKIEQWWTNIGTKQN